MFRKQSIAQFFIVCSSLSLLIGGCHTSAKKERQQVQALRDSVKTGSNIGKHTGPFPNFIILDTIAGADTIRFIMYADSLVRCSVNGLSDVCNCGGYFEHWDSSFGDQGLMLVPGKEKLQKFILNDSLLIVSVSYGFMRMSGGVALFLLTRSRHSLKFAPVNTDNPCRIGSEFPYVDIKTNQIIDYYYHEILNDEDAGNGGDEHARYLTWRARIKKGQFVQTDEITASSKEIEKMNLFDPGEKELRTYYTLLAQHEDWKRDRYDSNNIQRIVVIDTLIGKANIKVWYTNRGRVSCTVNGICDSTDWDEQWMGYEWWMKKDPHRILVPGDNKPKSLILNDSLLLFTLVNSDSKAELFLFDRKKPNLDTTQINTFANYIYVDLKHNTILSYVDSDNRVDLRDDAQLFPHPKDAPCEVDKYKIQNHVFKDDAGFMCMFDKGKPYAWSIKQNFLSFYTRVIQGKNAITPGLAK